MLDDVMDFFGLITVLKGTFLRMVGRGHKLENSKQSEQLVTTGIYSVVRNPMYLGSYLIGAGFVLIVWPWWTLPIFTFVFYKRFEVQVLKEEKFLGEQFGKTYKDYCLKTPRAFPHIDKDYFKKMKNSINLNKAFKTKEVRGLIAWPVLAIILEMCQQRAILGFVDLERIIVVFGAATLTFFLGLLLFAPKK